MSEKDLLLTILEDVKEIKESLNHLPEEFAVTDVARQLGVSRQAVHKKLLNGDFEPGVDFKYKGNKIYVARSTVSKLKRLRK